MGRRYQKNHLLGLYKRKLVFFSFMFGLVLIGFSVFNSSFKADEPVGDFLGGESINRTLDLKSNGDIYLDGKKTSYKVDILEDADEIRLPILEKPESYIGNFQVTLNLPGNFSDKVKPSIITQHGVDSSSYSVSSDNQILYQALGISESGEVTVVANFPKGFVKPPLSRIFLGFLNSLKQSFWLVIAVIIPTITSIFMVIVLVYLYRRQKIDMPSKEVDSPPMVIPPAVVGALYKQKVGPREIAATLVDLARRGDIFIVDRERGFSFGKGKYDQRLLGFEKILLSKIFTKSISSSQQELEERVNRHLYSKKMSMLTVGIYLLSTRLGYFKANPYKLHFRYRLLGIMLFLLSFAGFIISLYLFTDPPYAVFFWIGAMVSSLIISVSASNMPVRTPIGQEVLSNWFAFKKFLSNPTPIPYSESNPELFQKYLPYAIVLECEAAWAKRFSEHSFMLPEWFITEKNGLGLDDFCLALYPIVSYISKSFAGAREPGFQ